MASRILLTQLRRIGDVLMTTPAVQAMREAYPQAHIAYLTEAPSDQVLAGNPHIDEVLVWPRRQGLLAAWRMLRRLRARRFDLVVDFFSNPTSAKITRLTAAPRRIGFSLRGRRWAYTDTPAVPELPYSAQHKLALLTPLLAPPETLQASEESLQSPPALSQAPPVPLLPQIYPAPAHRGYAERQLRELGVGGGDLLVAISPVSRRPYKVWPAAHFARLADNLIERYSAKVLFCWGPGEEQFVDAVRLEMIHQALPSYPVPSLMQLAALLERAQLLVGNDNGPRHFAIAVGTPTVGIFGRPLPENWTPPDAPMHPTVEHDPGCKRACTYPRCGMECIRDLPYGAVERTMENILEELLKDGKPA